MPQPTGEARRVPHFGKALIRIDECFLSNVLRIVGISEGVLGDSRNHASMTFGQLL